MEIGYYTNPLERLIRMHSSTVAYPHTRQPPVVSIDTMRLSRR
jgi:hypothetical protein